VLNKIDNNAFLKSKTLAKNFFEENPEEINK